MWNRRQQAARVFAIWPLQDGFTGALLDDPPGLHYGHMVGDVLDDAGVEGDEEAVQAGFGSPRQALDDRQYKLSPNGFPCD